MKMKKVSILLVLTIVLIASLLGCAKDESSSGATSQNTSEKTSMYKEGTYDVQTEPDREGFFCIAKVTIKEDMIQQVEWKISDSNNRIFDETYEEVYAGNEHYQDQCRKDLAGAKTYAASLIKVQDVEKVDSISGATWSNEKFKEVMRLALSKAKN